MYVRLRILNLAACSHTARDIENDKIRKAVEHIVFVCCVSLSTRLIFEFQARL